MEIIFNIFSNIFYIFLVIFAFFFIILFHEYGHYLGCKITGVKVEEFSIGLGKEIWSKVINGTKYSLRLLPLGGYVLPEGENYDPNNVSPTNFYAKPLYSRFIIIFLGPFFNYILAFFIFFIIFSFFNPSITTEVFMLKPNTPAYNYLKTGDIILQVNNLVLNYKDGQKMINYIHSAKDKELYIKVKRGNEIKEFKIKTLWDKVNNFAYIGFNPKSKVFFEIDFVRGFSKSISTIYDITYKYLNVILSIFTGHISLKTVYEQSAGPIGITKIMYDFATQGIYDYLMLIGLINIIIGLFNLFPFPALDGGRLLFIIINYILIGISLVLNKVGLYTKNIIITPDKEEIFHKIGLIVLLIFVVFVSFNDVGKIIRGESFIK
jgi:regulator of sigma E protease